MKTHVFLKTGGSIMKDKSSPNKTNSPYVNTNTSRFLSTMNNKSLSTNESGTAYTSGMYNRTNMKGNRRLFNKYSYLKINPEATFNQQNLDKNITQNNDNDFLNDFYSTAKVSSQRKEIFKDADQILKDRIRRLGGTGPLRQTRTSVLEKTKEVCLNNYLITQLKEKRTDINKKEIFINTALKSSETQFEIDYKTFIDFVEEIKKKEKEDEEKLSNLKVTRERIENELNQLIYTNKKLEDESEHTIKQIVLLKAYGSFVHNVFHIPFIYDELKPKPLGKKYMSLCSKIISLYDKKEYSQIPKEKLKDDELLLQFSNFEEKLVKILEEKERLDTEIHSTKSAHNLELEQLKQRLKDCEIEEKSILQTKANMGHISHIKHSSREMGEAEQFLEYISELGSGVGVEVPKGGTKSKSISDYLYLCKDTINALNKKECMINEYITQIDDIINNGDKSDKIIILDLINEQKKYIKREKQLRLKKEKDEEENLKKQRAIERAKRIVIKGRQVYHENPPHKKKSKKVKVEENNDDELYQYLNYTSSSESNN